jgi:hypothetical protein
MFVVGTVYNFCTPHESLHAGQKTTPAMAAGITDHCWTMQELLSFPVPLPRWAPPKQRRRPSRAFQRLVGARNHGLVQSYPGHASLMTIAAVGRLDVRAVVGQQEHRIIAPACPV